MRKFSRIGISAGVLAAAAAIAITITGVRAASPLAPTPPYDAITIGGVTQSGLSGQADTYTFDENSPIPVSGAASPGSLQMTAGNTSIDATTFILGEPVGGQFAAGVTYPTSESGATATNAYMMIALDATACSGGTGTLAVLQADHDGSGDLTAFAATYTSSCGAPWTPVSGELRWHSTVGYRAATTDIRDYVFPTTDLGAQTPAQTVTVTVDGSDPVTLQAASVDSTPEGQFTVTDDQCAGKTLTYGQTCTVSFAGTPTALGQQNGTLTIPDDTVTGKLRVFLQEDGVKGSAGTFSPVPPYRLLDTRHAIGAPMGRIAAGGTVRFQVDGRGFLPASGISAVVLNVTETDNTAAGFITTFPDGLTRPNTSSLNFSSGETRANSVTVPVGSDGMIAIYDGGPAAVDLLADVTGYFVGSDDLSSQGEFQPTQPQRILDSRVQGGALKDGYYYQIPVDYGSTYNPHIKALAVNITSTASTEAGYLIAWDGLINDLPATSVLNYAKGVTTPNFAVVPTLTCTDPTCAGQPMIGVMNKSSGTTQLIVDIVGFFDDGSIGDGLRFHPITPTRIVDTRSNVGIAGTIGAGATATVTTPATIRDNLTFALSVNVTAVAPTASTYLTLWPTSIAMPNVSTVNALPGKNVANAAISLLSDPPGAQFNVRNAAGSTGLIVDVSGTYEYYPFDHVTAAITAGASSGILSLRSQPRITGHLTAP